MTTPSFLRVTRVLQIIIAKPIFIISLLANDNKMTILQGTTKVKQRQNLLYNYYIHTASRSNRLWRFFIKKKKNFFSDF